MRMRNELFIEASPEEVWKVHTDINAWNQWHSGINSAALKEGLAIGSIFHWSVGNMTFTSKIYVLDAGQQIAWESRMFGMQTVQLWAFEAQSGGTHVVTETTIGGWLLSLLFRKIIMRSVEKTMDFWLQNLKARLEGKEAPSFDDK